MSTAQKTGAKGLCRIGRRRYSPEDQHLFAKLSGDYSPVHIDPIAARRTLFGEPAVHGVSLMMWAIDTYFHDRANRHQSPVSLAHVTAQFSSPAFLNETVEAVLLEESDEVVRLHVVKGDLLLAGITLKIQPGPPVPQGPDSRLGTYGDVAQEHNIEGLLGHSGEMKVCYRKDELEKSFPTAVSILGPGGVATLLSLTRQAGMVCPGRHSLFSGLSVNIDPRQQAGLINYEVVKAEPRVSMVQVAVSGSGVEGVLNTFNLPPPPGIGAMDIVAGYIEPGLCKNHLALIIGGSRGLGEVAAKLVACGGGDVVIGYANGREDAERVRRDILDAGGRCEIMHADITDSSLSFNGLAERKWYPTHIYYFATPRITQRPSAGFNSLRFRQFLEFYADGFYKTYKACRHLTKAPLRFFYPSTVAIDKFMDGLAEYTQAKAAGEFRCRRLEKEDPEMAMLIERLPPLATDQTASLVRTESDDPLPVMAEAVNKMAAL